MREQRHVQFPLYVGPALSSPPLNALSSLPVFNALPYFAIITSLLQSFRLFNSSPQLSVLNFG